MSKQPETELEAPPALDGRYISSMIRQRAGDLDALPFWAGMAAARLVQYQRVLEAAGIELPESG